jgi:hypothetical protein
MILSSENNTLRSFLNVTFSKKKYGKNKVSLVGGSKIRCRFQMVKSSISVKGWGRESRPEPGEEGVWQK